MDHLSQPGPDIAQSVLENQRGLKSMKTIPTKLKLTSKAIEEICALRVDERSRRYWDITFAGFYMQFSKAGTPSFMMRYTRVDGSDGDISLGLVSRVPVDLARSAAREKMAALTLHGIDPVAERRRRREESQQATFETFSDIAEAYMAKKAAKRPGKADLDEFYFLRNYVMPVLGKQRLMRITKQTVVDLLEQIRADVASRRRRKGADGKHTANACQRAIKRVYNWAVDDEHTTKNPAAFPCLFPIKKAKRVARLDKERFGKFWREIAMSMERHYASKAGPLAALIFMTTLQRPIDVARAMRSHINFETKEWNIPEDYTKTGYAYHIPLSDLAVALFKKAFALSEGALVFPSDRDKAPHIDEHTLTTVWIRARDRLIKTNELDDVDVELYDCRRFGRTQIRHELKYGLEVAEAVINHVGDKGMATLYDVFDYRPAVREAQDAWGGQVFKMVGASGDPQAW